LVFLLAANRSQLQTLRSALSGAVAVTHGTCRGALAKAPFPFWLPANERFHDRCDITKDQCPFVIVSSGEKYPRIKSPILEFVGLTDCFLLLQSKQANARMKL
jgi:hypothetical protein